MSKIFKAFMFIVAVIFISIYLFYAISFGLEIMGLVEAIDREGFREALSQGSSDIEFYASAATLVLQIAAIYIIPLILVLVAIVHFLRRQRKTA
ncbi:MAG: hypothetical protein WBL93_00095 [Lutisporaceae bacterium]